MRQRRTPANAGESRAVAERLPLEVMGKPSLYVQAQKSTGAHGVRLTSGEATLEQYEDIQRRATDTAAEQERALRRHESRTAIIRVAIVLVLLAVAAVVVVLGHPSS